MRPALPAPGIQRPSVSVAAADDRKGPGYRVSLYPTSVPSSKAVQVARPLPEAPAGSASAASMVPCRDVGYRETPDVDLKPATLPASWSAIQVAALRQELRAAEKTVEELKRMLRAAEAAVQT